MAGRVSTIRIRTCRRLKCSWASRLQSIAGPGSLHYQRHVVNVARQRQASSRVETSAPYPESGSFDQRAIHGLEACSNRLEQARQEACADQHQHRRDRDPDSTQRDLLKHASADIRSEEGEANRGRRHAYDLARQLQNSLGEE